MAAANMNGRLHLTVLHQNFPSSLRGLPNKNLSHHILFLNTKTVFYDKTTVYHFKVPYKNYGKIAQSAPPGISGDIA